MQLSEVMTFLADHGDERTKAILAAAVQQAASDLPRFDQLPCDILQHNAAAVPCPWPPPASSASVTLIPWNFRRLCTTL